MVSVYHSAGVSSRFGKRSLKSAPKVTFITQLFAPEEAAAAKRANSIVYALEKLDLPLDVLTFLPNYPTGEVYAEYQDLVMESCQGKTRVQRLKPIKTPLNKLFRRMIAELRFCAWSFVNVIRLSSTLLIITSPSMFLIMTAYLWGLVTKKVWIADIRDLTWLYLIHVKGGKLKKISQVLERIILYCLKHPRNAFIIAATPGIHAYLLQSGLSTEKIVTCLNGVSAQLVNKFTFQPKTSASKQRCITFVGNMGYNYDLQNLLDVAKQRPEYHFRLVGDGPQKARLQRAANMLSNVVFPGHLSGDALVAEFEKADLFYCGLLSTEVLNKTALPVKLFEYMAAGRPYIYSGEGLIESFVKDYPAGQVVTTYQAEDIAQSIDKLFDANKVYTSLALTGKKLSQKFQREDLMFNTLSKLLEKF